MKFINFIKFFASLLILISSSSAYAQLSDGFDIKKARQDAINKGISTK